MSRRTRVLAALLLLALPLAAAPLGTMGSVSIGEKKSSVRDKCAAVQGASITEFFAEKPQHMAEGLLRSDLLLMLNRARAKHTLLDESEKRKVSFIRMETEKSGDAFVFAFAEDRLEAALRKAKVPIAGGKFDRDRLAPLKSLIGAYAKSCNARPLDPSDPNPVAYAGACDGSTRLYMEYRPAQDEMWILLHK